MGMYEASVRARNAQRADLVEDLLSGGADSKEGVRAALKRIKQLRKR